MTTAKSILENAKEMLTKETWAQGGFCFVDGKPVSFRNLSLNDDCKFCAVGALNVAAIKNGVSFFTWNHPVSENSNGYSIAMTILNNAARQAGSLLITNFNDSKTFEEVQGLFDTAIDNLINTL